MTLKPPTSVLFSLALLIAFAVLAPSVLSQQKRPAPVKPQPAPAPTPAPAPPPTFDTLLAANSYKIYGEVRSVGQLVRSNTANEILEPIMKLASPPKEFRTVVRWLNTHADELMTSRMLIAGWSTGKEIPDALMAIEFASAEEATKFQQHLNGFLQKVMPPLATPGETNKTEPPRPQYHVQQAGSLLVLTLTPLNLKKLRPAGSRLLSEDANFRIARNRFNTETIFVFVDVAEIEKEEQERSKQFEEAHKKAIAENAAKQAAEPPTVELDVEPEEIPETFLPEQHAVAGAEAQLQSVPPSQQPPPEQAATPRKFEYLFLLSLILSSFSGAEAKYPDSVGFAISLEGESIDVRALLVNAPGEKSDPIPFFPALATGPAIAPDAPNILPADTEMLVTLSLDLPQMHATMSKPQPTILGMRRGAYIRDEAAPALESPFAALERRLKIKIKDDLLPLIGSEIAVSVPMTGMDFIAPLAAPPPAPPSPPPSASPSSSPNETHAKPARHAAVAISLKDKEGMRALLPKLIESIAFKGASAFAQTERREDTELISYANVVSYAFVGNFLVISPDVATTRHIVDSYLKRQTLAGEQQFKNYTRWQPRQLHGQIYLSASLMESYKTWIQQPTTRVDEQTRAYLSRFTVVPEPVTYSLSNEGFGPLHELHLPKNLVLLLVTALNALPYAAEPPADSPTGPAVTPPVNPDPN